MRQARAAHGRQDGAHGRRAGARDPPPRLHDQPPRGVRRGGGGAAHRAARRRGHRAHARPARGRGAAARLHGDRGRPRHPARGRRRGVGPRGDAQAIVAAITAAEEADGGFDLIVCGNESADAGNFQVGIRVAYALGRPVATGLKGLSDGHRARCEQEVPGGRDVYELALPAVVSVLEGINLPRYPSVPAKLRARQKPVERSAPERPESRLEKVRLLVPAGQGVSRPRSSARGPTRPRRWSRSCATWGWRSGRRARAGGARRGRRRRALAPGAHVRPRAGGRRARGRPARGRRRKRRRGRPRRLRRVERARGRGRAARGLRARRLGALRDGRDRARRAERRGGGGLEPRQRGARPRGHPPGPHVRRQLHGAALAGSADGRPRALGRHAARGGARAR